MTADELEDARRFLDVLAGDEAVTFQTVPEGSPDKKLNRILHGSLDQHAPTLIRLNGAGAAIHVMVNRGDSKGRRADNVVAVRALFVDLDGSPVEPVLAAACKPHVVVQTSPGKYHCYWLVDGATLEDFRSLQRALARRFSGDPTVCDLPRVMRVPGFKHLKGAPVTTKIVVCAEGPRLTVNDLVNGLGLAVNAEPLKTVKSKGYQEAIPEGARNSTLFAAARGMNSRGIPQAAARTRILTMNASRCDVPLPLDEVEALTKQAYAYSNDGFVSVPHSLFDSQLWKTLPHPARSLFLSALRRAHPGNDFTICLPHGDFEGESGYSHNSFYKFRRQLVKSGLLREVSRVRGPDLKEIVYFQVVLPQ